MLGSLDLRKGLRAMAPQILGAAICAYFVYHAVQGDRGLIAWLQLSRELAESQAVLADLSAERAALEHRVSLLRPESLDPDMLEEQARIMLNFGRPDDRTLLLPPEPAASR
jgi:cell division protein FtsB